jgi:hypothetical protein
VSVSRLAERVSSSPGQPLSLADREEKICAYMHWHNETDQPFEWSHRPKSWSQKHVQTSGARN